MWFCQRCRWFLKLFGFLKISNKNHLFSGTVGWGFFLKQGYFMFLNELITLSCTIIPASLNIASQIPLMFRCAQKNPTPISLRTFICLHFLILQCEIMFFNPTQEILSWKKHEVSEISELAPKNSVTRTSDRKKRGKTEPCSVFAQTRFFSPEASKAP